MGTLFSIHHDDRIIYNHLSYDNPDDNDFYLHTHDTCEIIYLISGNASAVIGEKTYKLQRGSLIIFRANIPHRIRIDGAETYERHDIMFDEKQLANGVFYKIPKEYDLINCGEDSHITGIFESLDYYFRKFQGDDFGLLVKNKAEELLYNLSAEPFEEFNVNQVAIHPVLRSAVEYINRNYKDPITIADICREVCVTKSHLHHLFMKKMKISPKKFINMKRLSKAQKLIALGEKPTSIYTECGFWDYGTFFRNYTKHFGYSPSQKDEIINERKIES